MCQAWDQNRHSVVTMASRLALAASPQSKGETAKAAPQGADKGASIDHELSPSNQSRITREPRPARDCRS